MKAILKNKLLYLQNMASIVEMKHLIFVVCIILRTSAYPAMSQTLHESSVAKIHEQWISQYGRSYTDDAEKEKRLKIFMKNLEFIENFNAQNKSYKMGLNQFADLTTEEFIASHTGLKISDQKPFSSKVAPVAWLNLSNIPTSIDWREYGAVTHVKTQGRCDCCWAFSALASVEGLIKIKTGYLISLSEQQLVDCIEGCNPSRMEVAYKYIVQNGVGSEIDYPYQAYPYTCRQNEMSRSAHIRGFVNLPWNSEEQLLQAVAYQPVSVPISTNANFRFYKQGIFTGPCGNGPDHAVAAIGYGISEDGYKYWLIKNSWGPWWGEGGFMRLLRESGPPEGLCGITSGASYPT